MPSFPDAVRDLETLVTIDVGAIPPDKYSLLADAAIWTTNIGYPGHTSAAISSIFYSGLIPTMFAQAAKGQLAPEEALDQTDVAVRRIFAKWKESGKV